MRVLATIDYYLPGYKGGGPIQSLANLVGRLGDELEFTVVTRDRDLGDDSPYQGVTPGFGQSVGKASVVYLSPQQRSFAFLRRLMWATEYEVLYLNSLFSPAFTFKPLLLWRLGLVPHKPVIVAPRGEFSPGALALKGPKKKAYLAAARLGRLYDNVLWQASSPQEEADIRRYFGPRASVHIAPDLLAPGEVAPEGPSRRPKPAGELRVVFLSRVSRMKNLHGALGMLRGVRGEVRFDIYGPLEDASYWAECERTAALVAPNITVEYHGPVAHSQVGAVLGEHDLFFLPSLGENFGHVILEALVAGCPVLISDQTPWRGLDQLGVGWDLPLDRPEAFSAVLQQCVDMDAAAYDRWSAQTRAYGLSRIKEEDALERTRTLFQAAASPTFQPY